MPGTGDSDDLVDFDDRTRVDGGAHRGEAPSPTVRSVALDGQQEATRLGAPVAAEQPTADEPEGTVLIDSPFAEATSPAIATASLLVVEGNDRGKSFALAGGVQVIGRSLDCGIVLNDATVSRRHFQVEPQGDGWKMSDLGSGNGTKVDGQRVPTIILQTGMRIEAGQSVLEFVGGQTPAVEDDEDRTRAVEMVPEAVPTPTAPKTIHPREAPRIEVVDVPSVPARRFPAGLAAVSVAVAVLLSLAVAQFGFGVRILPLGEEAPSSTTAQETTPAREDGAALMARATRAIQERQWDPALTLLAAAKEQVPDLAGIDEAGARARDEKRAASLLAAARDLVEKGTPDEARGLLSRIPDTSIYFAEARQELAGLDTRHIAVEIEAIRARVREGRKSEARQDFVALIANHPEDPRVLAMRDELFAAGIAVEPPAPRPVAATAAVPAAAPAAIPPPAAAPAAIAPPAASAPSSAPARNGKADLAQALSAYDKGLFQQASATLRSTRIRGDDPARAQTLADRIDRFAVAYSEGKATLAGKRLDRAESALSASLRLDSDINGHYAPEIRMLLGDTFRSRAAAAIQNADYGLAAQSATKALSFRPEDDMARTILDKCLVMAQKVYDAAQADWKAGRKDEARLKARTVLDIVPKGHALEERASALLK
jgi:pSer/pThr/pTyr-binding forkhead associated (FHA) protein/tetratricopeptide (TPR) repeat protein